MGKYFYIKTFGCQMNVYDSAKIKDILVSCGYEETTKPEGASIILLNTCHIREKAAEKVFSDLGRLRVIKEEKEGKGDPVIMIVAGCVVQAEDKQISKRAPYVDIAMGPQTYHRLPQMIEDILKRKKQAFEEEKTKVKSIIDTDFPPEPKFDYLPEATSQGSNAFLAIQEGCDRFCSYCVVPYTRGIEYSRNVEEIIKEANELVNKGAVEINLLGQNVNAYHGVGYDGKEWSFAKLLYEIDKIKGLKRIRYTTSYPSNMTDELIKAHKDIEKIMPYLHLPIQSGSDKILKEMNRKYTSKEYLSVIKKLKEAVPQTALSSDFIVGFPGETDEDFQETLEIVKKVKYAQAYSFKYSPRAGTPAADMKNQVDEKIKKERLAILQDLLNKQQMEFNLSCVGKEMDVLFDKLVEKDKKQLVGRTPYMQAVYITANKDLYGKILKVKITHAGPNSLMGELV